MSCPRCGGTRSERLVQSRRPIVLGLYAAGLVLAFTLTGSLLHDIAEGGQRSLLPMWKLWVPVAILVLAVVVTIFRKRQLVCDACEAAKPAWLWVPLPRAKSAEILSG